MLASSGASGLDNNMYSFICLYITNSSAYNMHYVVFFPDYISSVVYLMYLV
jgi:hypothetical protein